MPGCRHYFKDELLEKEVNTMTKTLYDPEVEMRGMQLGENIKALVVLLPDLRERSVDAL